MALENNHFRLAYTSMVYIYKMFKHLTMQWMVIHMDASLLNQSHGGGLSRADSEQQMGKIHTTTTMT
jgi:hypothetical protein